MSNEMNMTIDEARALVSDAALWPRVRDFLWDFAPQVHSSWLEGVGHSLSTSPRVKRFILSSLGVEPCFHTFPKNDWSRLALLDGAMLESIAKWLGAIACADSLRRVTDGKTVRDLKAALPGVYPEVFGYTAYFERDLRDARDGGEGACTAEHVVSHGFSLIHSLLCDVPGPVISRVKFKLPESLRALLPMDEAEDAPEGAGPVLTKLLKLKFPEAYSLCCS